MGLIAQMAKSTAAHMEEARSTFSLVELEALESGKTVQDAVRAMSEIESSSEQITRIIGVINDIAFQTNLLALNAGVEAARAGESGRGFAVVASEVRALAQRSAEAAKEIKTLIAASTANVAGGVELVDQTGRTLNKIVDQIGGITPVVSRIAGTANDQAARAIEVYSALAQLEKITMHNAAMVSDTTSTSHALSDETRKLNSTVSRFRIPEAVGAMVAPPPRVSLARDGNALRQTSIEAEDWQDF